ncbi:hypothetical protein SEA_NEOS5_99 [Mycobacterium phage Neos5]|uniref:Uncharacterized protein n=1 Tax=Mycobacterium phage Baloo TaxID=2099645 RepID=A0A2P1CD01_9CAUD|nr:gp100 [Mycobacterium phage Phlyer]YP_009018611.1 hypothetical protein CM10_gp101 [Mycobacterium phage Akoma]AHN84316.1 hypothetical protein HEATHCLIFF_100 [Mycobacterium phage Heathcliff]AJD82689.1 hypothetical protein CHANDLER_100 [Mycobacterium phage Chandler]AKF15027.1 hypothetical protein SEA_ORANGEOSWALD_99 [Mycobacterium phage OrangeOswald]AKG94899.1 hypothetical protein SEA_COROFIN_100 [Mycobacterium phage Corofin]AUX82584.1 hypothetical protein SEA_RAGINGROOSTER_100 [Mycobacterium 
MIEIEVVGVKDGHPVRHIERQDGTTVQAAVEWLDPEVRRTMGEKVLLRHVVTADEDGQCLAYRRVGGEIVAFANVFEVVGE